MKAIETFAYGHRFRSRLEARWAVFLTEMGITWHYEHQGYETSYGPYLPDFWLPEYNTFLEIKGQKPTSEEISKLYDLIESANAFGAFGFSFQNNKFIEDIPNSKMNWPKGPKQLFDMLDLPKAFFANIEPVVHCPFCGPTGQDDSYNCIHTGNPIIYDEDYSYEYLMDRGPVTVIPFWAELCQCKWELAISFHKGHTQMVYVYPIQKNYGPFFYQLESSLGVGVVERCILKAKSARFEHGESPR